MNCSKPCKLRANLPKTVDQMRESYERSNRTLKPVMQAFERSFDAAVQGAAVQRLIIIDFAQKNLNLGFHRTKSLAGASSLSEIVELHAVYWRKQFDAFTTQAEEVRGAAKPKVVETWPEAIQHEPAKENTPSCSRGAEKGHSPPAEIFRRALGALRGPRNGPVLVAVANDVLNGPAGEADWDVQTAQPRLTQASADDVAETARALLAAAHPVILAGQGVLYAGATAELVRLAELTGTPVATTLNGKSAFPENHPLALGTAGRTRPATVDRFFEQADLVLGIGTSFTRSLYITPLPSGATLGQITDDRRDLATGYDIAFGCVGDARLVLLQLLDAVGEARSERREATEGAVADVRAAFMGEWFARLTSEASPLSPYRVVWELMHAGRPDAHRRHARCRPPA